MRQPFEYALIRLVPRIERGEQINVGVLLYCQHRDFLAARTHLDADRVRALAPDVDLPAVAAVLASWDRTCAGDGPATGMRLGRAVPLAGRPAQHDDPGRARCTPGSPPTRRPSWTG